MVSAEAGLLSFFKSLDVEYSGEKANRVKPQIPEAYAQSPESLAWAERRLAQMQENLSNAVLREIANNRLVGPFPTCPAVLTAAPIDVTPDGMRGLTCLVYVDDQDTQTVIEMVNERNGRKQWFAGPGLSALL